jgi:hypothetical protein
MINNDDEEDHHLFPCFKSLEDRLRRFRGWIFNPTVSESSVDYLPQKVDKAARIFVPLAFLICEILYWTLLLNLDKTTLVSESAR